MTTAEFCALRLLVGDGPQSLSLLSRWVSISNGGTTKLVDRLEARGLVARIRDLSDRRVVHVEPTAEGTELVQRVFPEHLRNIEALMDSLDGDQTGQLFDLLTLLQAGINDRVLSRVPGAPDPGVT
ncbi:MarR family winged helix-turn-helix transcriptional regulator [Nitriliruptor alkaliphilus]|uniref:MarR family winged helix-turn-helix transcriptional regulator n=1 Tax=Nitriliruptor alkaliphilus TaxID=427918 RepID=UPI001B801411|nr:MarR family transcriptional regulator [Nitriliruptor alkaliphilus]